MIAISAQHIVPGIIAIKCGKKWPLTPWKVEKMRHLRYEDRIRIETLVKIHTQVKVIAAQLGRCFSTIYAELRRGRVELLDKEYRTYVSYSADVAQQKHDYAQTAKGRPLKIGNDHAFAAYIEYKIKHDRYSPAAALAAARRSGRFVTDVCINTLYSYIYAGVLQLTPRDLLRGRPKRQSEPKTPPKVTGAPAITDRPEYINDRSELGHWEMDCVCSSTGQTAALLVLTERVSRYELIFKIPDKTTASVVRVIDGLERRLGADFPYIFQSITVDNGSEFRDYDGIRLGIAGAPRTEVYYCHPYCSSERGSNENANSIIRRFFPKGTNFAKVSKARVQRVQDWMNHYPRRVLDWCCAADFRAAI